MLKQLAVSELVPGMMVTRVVEQSGPVKIRKVGFIRSPDMIKGLKEMGVTMVEVNLDESLNIELAPEESEAHEGIASQENTISKKTATQRLVASNKQIADVDRQLSQQFHRSLFMPAVDQMPSKWVLYGKPYAILLAYIVSGFLIGGVSSYTIMALTTGAEPTVVEAIDTSVSDAPTDLPGNQSQVIKSPSEDKPIVTNTTIVSPQAQNDEEKNDTKRIALEPEVEQPNMASNAAAETKTNTIENVNATNKVDPPIEQVLINGVLLEEGQQVLGYQASDDDVNTSIDSDENTQDNSTQNNIRRDNVANLANSRQSTNNDEVLDSELYRRIQRVAQDVDDQPKEPQPQLVKVTDLNDLPRIDQLPPALLTQMPAMSFSAHMYASNAQDRWVRVNSQRFGEGDTIADDILLKRIESEKVVLEYKGTEFTMNALSDW